MRDVAAYSSNTLAASVRIGTQPGPAQVLTVSANYFDVLGLRAEAGRFFLAAENQTMGTHPVAVVSHAFWVKHLGSARGAVGRDMLLNGHRFTVVGVAPRDYRGLSPDEPRIDIYIPIMMRNAVAPQSDRAWYERIADSRERWVAVVGRLKPGVSVDAAQADLARIAAHIRTIDPGGDTKETVLVSQQFRWYPTTRGNLASLTRVLLVAVGLLLAVATANVAILLLARASTRDREIGVRAALGAGRGRIARQMLTESLLLGVSDHRHCTVLARYAARRGRPDSRSQPARGRRSHARCTGGRTDCAFARTGRRIRAVCPLVCAGAFPGCRVR